MEVKTAYVWSFRGQKYGYDEHSIRISFHYGSGYALYPKGKTKEHGPYHLDEEDIIWLSKEFSSYIPSYGAPYYQGIVTDWGYDTEEGLCKLMMEEKLILKRNGYQVAYKWVGNPWNAEQNRNKKRKLPKNPNLL
jgi:hypothetical protein